MQEEQNTKIKATDQVEVPVCPLCDSESVDTIQHTNVFDYGVGGTVVRLKVDLPVRYCAACDLEFLDHVGQRLRHDAVCRYLGVLTPSEVQQIREGYGMTRAEFAELTGLGEATLGRWETAAVIQNRANDLYLRLIQIPSIMQDLRRLGQSAPEAYSREAAVPEQFAAMRDLEVVSRSAHCFRPQRARSYDRRVLTSAEVLQIRKDHGMTRSEFAKVTGLGEATLSRWEAGRRMNRANELYLRLIQIPSIMQVLRRLGQSTSDWSKTAAEQFAALLVVRSVVKQHARAFSPSLVGI